ncbi:hypothetical protein [Longispora albida]|uniref:hypothetical protein n=1 Tax=Longispora albida TaxID=203523 RepID=UPI00036B9557|nr:hypothetical protein [Longispora albida]
MTQDDAIPQHSIAQVVEVLAAITAEQAGRGFHRPPELFFLLMEPVPATIDRWRVAARPVPVPAADWFAHQRGPLGVLADLITAYRQPHSQALLITTGTLDPYTRLIGWGFTYVLENKNDLAEQMLFVDTVDLDLRFYRITQRPSEAEPVRTVDDTWADPVTGPLLAALLDATR